MPNNKSSNKTSCRCSNTQCSINLYANILFEKTKPKTAIDWDVFYGKVDRFPKLELQRKHKLKLILDKI